MNELKILPLLELKKFKRRERDRKRYWENRDILLYKQKEYTKKNREVRNLYLRNRRKKLLEKGICECGNNPVVLGFKKCKECRLRNKIAGPAKYLLLKKKIYDYYGNRCNCCGETEEKFLSIDHVNNDGYLLRYSTSSGRRTGANYSTMKEIIDRNFPKDFQILCMNCNWGKSRNNGICPHKKTTNYNVS